MINDFLALISYYIMTRAIQIIKVYMWAPIGPVGMQAVGYLQACLPLVRQAPPPPPERSWHSPLLNHCVSYYRIFVDIEKYQSILHNGIIGTKAQWDILNVKVFILLNIHDETRGVNMENIFGMCLWK